MIQGYADSSGNCNVQGIFDFGDFKILLSRFSRMDMLPPKIAGINYLIISMKIAVINFCHHFYRKYINK